MARPHSPLRTLAALILLGIMAAVLFSLGQWQLRRADERRGVLAAIQAGQRQAPITLTPRSRPDDLVSWRPAQAQGQWRGVLTVVLDNRNQDGKPGYWVATPLMLDAASNTAVLVLRGWVPRVPGAMAPQVPAAPEGAQAVQGQLVDRVPRLFELWHFGGGDPEGLPPALPAQGGVPPVVQNLDLGAYMKATGLHLLPAVLEQTGAAADGMVRDWPQPSVDFERNEGYALQWFSFAAIAAIAFVVVAWRAARRGKTMIGRHG
jgi:cytochrome oxidase assembly protein ShyY1